MGQLTSKKLMTSMYLGDRQVREFHEQHRGPGREQSQLAERKALMRKTYRNIQGCLEEHGTQHHVQIAKV